MEANLAPYKAKYRYYMGLLLFMRIAIYLGVALDESHKNSVSLLVTSLIAFSLFLLKALLADSIYRKSLIGHIDTIFVSNLLIFCLAQLYCRKFDTHCRTITAEVSVSITFIALVGILFYHVLLTMSVTKCLNKSMSLPVKYVSPLKKCLFMMNLIDVNHTQLSQCQGTEMQLIVETTPTSTLVGLSPQHSASTYANSNNSDSKNGNTQNVQLCESNEVSTSVLNAVDISTKKDKVLCKDSSNWDGLQEPLLQD